MIFGGPWTDTEGSEAILALLDHIAALEASLADEHDSALVLANRNAALEAVQATDKEWIAEMEEIAAAALMGCSRLDSHDYEMCDITELRKRLAALAKRELKGDPECP